MNDFNSDRVFYLEDSDFQNGRLVSNILNRETGKNYFDGTTIVLVQGSYCGHCTSFKKVFQDVANKVSGHFDMATIQIDGKLPSEQIFQTGALNQILQQDLQGVPLVIKFRNGVRSGPEYQGDRSANDLMAWIIE